MGSKRSRMYRRSESPRRTETPRRGEDGRRNRGHGYSSIWLLNVQVEE